MDYVILDEQRRQGRLWLTVRADIWPGERRQQAQCASRYRPGMSITPHYPAAAGAGQHRPNL
ncbi:hypothetical protein MBH78_22360 [Oceanimonas sp. NS1]|nr:hypothetical protein [Oceanimonas sp. NS1]